jgi:hypothetical protein
MGEEGGWGATEESDWVVGLRDPPGRGGSIRWWVGELAVHHKELE